MYKSKILDKYTILLGSEIKDKIYFPPGIDSSLQFDYIKLRDELYLQISKGNIETLEDSKRYIISKEDIITTLESDVDESIYYYGDIEDFECKSFYNTGSNSSYTLLDKFVITKFYIYIYSGIITELSDSGYSNFIINLEALSEAKLLGLTDSQKRMISLLPTSNFIKWYQPED